MRIFEPLNNANAGSRTHIASHIHQYTILHHIDDNMHIKASKAQEEGKCGMKKMIQIEFDKDLIVKWTALTPQDEKHLGLGQ